MTTQNIRPLYLSYIHQYAKMQKCTGLLSPGPTNTLVWTEHTIWTIAHFYLSSQELLTTPSWFYQASCAFLHLEISPCLTPKLVFLLCITVTWSFLHFLLIQLINNMPGMGIKWLNGTYQDHFHGIYFPKRRWIIDNQMTMINSDCDKRHVEKKMGFCVRVNPWRNVI